MQLKCIKPASLFYTKLCPFLHNFTHCHKSILNLKPIWYWKDYTKTGVATDDVLLWKEDEIAHFEMDNYSPSFWGITNIETFIFLALKDIDVIEHGGT